MQFATFALPQRYNDSLDQTAARKTGSSSCHCPYVRSGDGTIKALRRFYALGGVVTFSLVVAGGDAHAQFVKVAFSPLDGVAPVPLSPWAMALMSCLMALLAWRGLRRKSPGRGWPLVLLVSLGLMLFGASRPWLPEAAAVTQVTSFNLAFPSPTISPELRIYQNISVTNLTGQTIRIDSISADWSYLIAPTQTPRCQPGLILSQAEVCYIRLAPML